MPSLPALDPARRGLLLRALPNARDILNRLCQHCFALDYRSVLTAYWQLFPYGLPFDSAELLPVGD